MLCVVQRVGVRQGLSLRRQSKETSPMKTLTATICLTGAVLLGNAGMSWSSTTVHC